MIPPPKKKDFFLRRLTLSKQTVQTMMKCTLYISSGSALFVQTKSIMKCVFHLGLDYLPKYPFRGFQSAKGLYIELFFKWVANQTNKQINALASVHFSNVRPFADLLLSREIPLLSLWGLCGIF